MQLLTFMLNNVRFGIPVDDVESIETRMSVVGVPNAPAHIEGIVNLHGDIVPICNLADYFEMCIRDRFYCIYSGQ